MVNKKQDSGFTSIMDNIFAVADYIYSVELVPGYSTEVELDQTLSVTPLSEFFLPHFPALWPCFAPKDVHPCLYLRPAVF